MEVKIIHILEHFEIGSNITGTYWVLFDGCRKIVIRKNNKFYTVEDFDYESSIANMKLLSEEESAKIKEKLEDMGHINHITFYSKGRCE